jgi:hypothetical protein
MRLRIKEHDQTDQAIYSIAVVDQETDRAVGLVICSKDQSRSVYLFEEKYKGKFRTDSECAAFVQGVEAVLNHMVSGRAKRAEDSPALQPLQNAQIPEISFSE